MTDLIEKPRVTSTARAVRIDEDEVTQYLRTMENIQSDLRTRTAELREVYEEARVEASWHTLDGQPAPIYVEALAALKQRIDWVVEQFEQLDRNLEADNVALRRYSAEYRAQSEETSAAIAGVTQ